MTLRMALRVSVFRVANISSSADRVAVSVFYARSCQRRNDDDDNNENDTKMILTVFLTMLMIERTN